MEHRTAVETILSIRNVGVVFEDGFTALDGVSIDIGKNEFVTLLGPSGWVEHSQVSANGFRSKCLWYSLINRVPPQR